MKSEKIIIANLKCGGCENTIKTKLGQIDGVENVEVIDAEDTVIIQYQAPATREKISAKLHDLGYPEATEENGLLLKIKSYASCVAGRVNNLTNASKEKAT